jgi:hypothetical protein
MVLEVLSIMVRKAWWSRDIQFMTSRKQSGAAHIMIGSRERERERERREEREERKRKGKVRGGRVRYICKGPTPSDLLPSARPLLLHFTEPLKIVPAAGNQMFKS